LTHPYFLLTQKVKRILASGLAQDCAPFVIPCLTRNLEYGFPRAPACAGHGRQAGMTGKHG